MQRTVLIVKGHAVRHDCSAAIEAELEQRGFFTCRRARRGLERDAAVRLLRRAKSSSSYAEQLVELTDERTPCIVLEVARLHAVSSEANCPAIRRARIHGARFARRAAPRDGNCRARSLPP